VVFLAEPGIDSPPRFRFETRVAGCFAHADYSVAGLRQRETVAKGRAVPLRGSRLYRNLLGDRPVVWVRVFFFFSPIEMALWQGIDTLARGAGFRRRYATLGSADGFSSFLLCIRRSRECSPALPP